MDEVLACIEDALGLFCSFLRSKTSIHNTQNVNSLQGSGYKLQTMAAESKNFREVSWKLKREWQWNFRWCCCPMVPHAPTSNSSFTVLYIALKSSGPPRQIPSYIRKYLLPGSAVSLLSVPVNSCLHASPQE